MNLLRKLGVIALIPAVMAAASPAHAQLYFQTAELTPAPTTGQEPGFALAGASPAENEAALVWSLRAALNVAALQCDLSQTLLTVNNYNAMLMDHKAELKKSFDTVAAYFVRVRKSKAAGQSALDQYGTRTYSGFSTVGGMYRFCQTAHSVGRDAVFAPRGQLLSVAQSRMRELREALAPSHEQLFPGFRFRTREFGFLPDPDKKCWSSKRWNGKCRSVAL